MTELLTIHDPRERAPRVRKREPGPRPDWLRVRYNRNETFRELERLKDGLDLVTVCEEARCPNIDECWSAGTATFMLMGEICTRRCGFCAVGKGKPGELDANEPAHTAEAVRRMNVKHAVITSVNRDDLPDGGAAHFAATVRAIRAASPQTRVELLIPDFMGDLEQVDHVLEAGAHIVAHNTETVPRLYKRVRPQAIYQRSLDVLRRIHEWPDVVSKTGLMLGLGETDAEVEDVMYELREVGCDILSLGQFLSPTPRHLPVERWVHPDTFARLAEVGRAMGFMHVEAGPMVRSSYMAHRPFGEDPMIPKTGRDLSKYFPHEDLPRIQELSYSAMAAGMVPSPILVIAYAVRAKVEAGERVVQFTVGDFAPSQFPIPELLEQGIIEAVAEGRTNYPPADGMPSLRRAIIEHYLRWLDLDYPLASVVVGSGARPVLYSTYRVLVSPGEKVLTPAPGWNNSNFCHLVGAQQVTVPSRPQDSFMPVAHRLAPHIAGARLLVLCSPMNPTGTMIRETQMAAICDLVLEENERRKKVGERLLYVVYDQVYRLLTFGDEPHVTPVGVAPEMAAYTIFSDAISKCFAATGLRVGWLVAPPFIAQRVRALMTHVGAWAPKPEQLATAQLLADDAAVKSYLGGLTKGLQARLDRLYRAFTEWASEGLPVKAIAPEGAIYLSVHFDLEGRPGFPDEDAVRSYLLDEANIGIIPFSAFGDHHNRGWFRFSVGVVSHDDLDFCLPRIKAALQKAVR